MYSYNNVPHFHRNMRVRNNGDRFFGGGILFPFILGGIAGGAIARNRFYPYPYYQTMPYYSPYPTTYYNNYYY